MTHAVVGVTLGTLAPFPRRWPFWVASALLPVLPDLDVIGWPLGVPFLSVWGHRGISHSLTAALVLGVIAAALTFRALEARLLPLALYFTAPSPPPTAFSTRAPPAGRASPSSRRSTRRAISCRGGRFPCRRFPGTLCSAWSCY